MELDKYNVVELTQEEQLLNNGGGPLGLLIGWMLACCDYMAYAAERRAEIGLDSFPFAG